MKKNILISLIIVLFSVDVYAKGGGGSFGGSTTVVSKFPAAQSRTYIKGIGNIKINANVNIRYRNWFGNKDWRTGYAKISITDTNNLPKRVYQLSIAEREMIKYYRIGYQPGRYAGIVRSTSRRNISSLSMNLKEILGPVAVQFVIYGSQKYGKSFFLENWWSEEEFKGTVTIVDRVF